MTQPAPDATLLVSCVRCSALHRPSDPLAAHTFCGRCSLGTPVPEARPKSR